MDTQNVREGMLGREIGGIKEKVTLCLDFSESKGRQKLHWNECQDLRFDRTLIFVYYVVYRPHYYVCSL